MTEANDKREQQLARRAKELFAESVDGLDGNARSRLALARAKALDARRARRFAFGPGGRPSGRQLLAAGGVAAAALAVVLYWQLPQTPTVVEDAVLNDLDILLEGENLDLFEELEFYAWLLEQPDLQEADDEDGSG